MHRDIDSLFDLYERDVVDDLLERDIEFDLDERDLDEDFLYNRDDSFDDFDKRGVAEWVLDNTLNIKKPTQGSSIEIKKPGGLIGAIQGMKLGGSHVEGEEGFEEF